MWYAAWGSETWLVSCCFVRSDRAYVAEANVLDELGVEVRLADDLLEEAKQDTVQWCVFEPAPAGFGQGRADGERDYDVVWVLFGDGVEGCLAGRDVPQHG